MKKLDTVFGKSETVFKYLFFTHTLLSFNNIFAGSTILKLFSYILAFCGMTILLYRTTQYKQYINSIGFPLLLAFMFSYVISSIYNIKYGYIENIQALIWMAFQLIFFYAGSQKDNKTIWGIFKYLNFYVLLANLASFVMLFCQYGRTRTDSFNGNIMGFVWGRLWGVYTDPNSGSVFSVAAILVSFYLLKNAKRIWVKTLYIFEIVLALCYITFSGSRTGIVTLIISLAFYSYLMLNKTLKINKLFLKTLLSCTLAIIIASAGYLSILTVKHTYNFAVNTLFSDDAVKDSVTIEREDETLETDISNQRFDLWLSGIEIWKKSPILGTSHRNIINFAVENTPDIYLITGRGIPYDSTHNAYIDILVSQGIIGALIFVIFFAIAVFIVFKKMFFTKNLSLCTNENILLLSIVISYAVCAIFILEIIYINTAGALLFWMSLGKLLHNLTQPKVSN